MTATVIAAFYSMLENIGFHHPVHAALVHIPIGLLVGASILGLTAHFRRKSNFRRCAWHCFIIVLVFFFPAVLTGIMDWIHRFAGAMLLPLQMKVLLAAVLLLLLLAGFYLGRANQGERKGLPALYAVCFVVVSGIGYFGGELVYGQGPPAAKQYQVGQQIFATNCASCHPNGGNTMKPKSPLKNSPKTADYKVFLEWVRKPDSPMPAFPPSALSDQQVKDLFDYTVNVINKR